MDGRVSVEEIKEQEKKFPQEDNLKMKSDHQMDAG